MIDRPVLNDDCSVSGCCRLWCIHDGSVLLLHGFYETILGGQDRRITER
jgi:hypothetical protein